MNRTEIADKVAGILRDIFDDDEMIVTDDTSADGIEDWDSLEQINILVAIEKQFGVKFSVGDVEDLKNVGEMIDLVVKKLA